MTCRSITKLIKTEILQIQEIIKNKNQQIISNNENLILLKNLFKKQRKIPLWKWLRFFSPKIIITS